MIQDLGPNSVLYFLNDLVGIVVGQPQITERAQGEGSVSFELRVDARVVARESATEPWQEIESIPADAELDPEKVKK